ncbi:hypothetical protein KCU61_g333, partial [Aureobasidium melanogenum]
LFSSEESHQTTYMIDSTRIVSSITLTLNKYVSHLLTYARPSYIRLSYSIAIDLRSRITALNHDALKKERERESASRTKSSMSLTTRFAPDIF